MNRECWNCASAKLSDDLPGSIAPRDAQVECGRVGGVFVHVEGICEKFRPYNEPRNMRPLPSAPDCEVSLLRRIETLEARFQSLHDLFLSTMDAVTKEGSTPIAVVKRIKALEKHRHKLPDRSVTGWTGIPTNELEPSDGVATHR